MTNLKRAYAQAGKTQANTTRWLAKQVNAWQS
jgi:hypothetical protein